MDKKQADAIFRLTSTPEWVLLSEYLNVRLAGLHRDLETYNKLDDIARLQGECAALRSMLALRDKADSVLSSRDPSGRVD